MSNLYSCADDTWVANGADEIDLIRIDPSAVPSSLPATLYIGVQAYGEPSEFSLLAAPPGSSAPVLLVPGQPQRGSLIGGDHTWFTFSPSTAGRVTFALTPRGGDPDLYVSSLPSFKAEDRWTCADPLFGAPTCASSTMAPGAVDIVTLSPGNLLYCSDGRQAECVYKVRKGSAPSYLCAAKLLLAVAAWRQTHPSGLAGACGGRVDVFLHVDCPD